MSAIRWTSLGALAALITGVSIGRPGVAAARQQLPAYVPGRLLVRFRSHVDSNWAKSILTSRRVRSARQLPGTGLQVVETPLGVSEAQFAAELARRPEVAFVEPDAVLLPSAIPDDPNFPAQWHLPQIGAPAAWDVSTGREGVTIAILDTGVDPSHPELAPKLVPGWNVWDNSANTSDFYGHGTRVAGAAGAIGNNALGIASPAWNCRLMPVRVTPNEGYATYSSIAAGLIWAADHGARIANVSFQASGSQTVADAAGYFQSRGGVVVIAAGNTGGTDPSPDNPYALTVGASTSLDGLAGFSTTGPGIDVAAPGVSINTTTMNGGYATANGTSFAAPVVAGVAALVLSTNPELNSSQVQWILKESADDLGAAGWDPEFGAGRVNASQAVELAAVTEAAPDTTAPVASIVTPVDGSISPVEVSAVDNIGVASVTLAVNDREIGTLTSSPYVFSFETKGGREITVTATVLDWAGNRTVAQVSMRPPKTVSPKSPRWR